MTTFQGVITAMVTAFDENGEVDLDGCRKMARHLVENGSDALVISGTTGESPTLDDSEKLAILRAVREEVGDDYQLIFGSGSNDTRHSVGLTAAGDHAGADAFLIVTPYYNKPTPEGIRAHFEACAEVTDKPIIVYNIPGRCVINIPPEDLAKLAEIENIVAVKQANNEDLQAIEGLEILAGNDEVFFRTLQAGGTGGILVASHLVGPQMKAIQEAWLSGDAERAAQLDAELSDVYEMCGMTTNPIPVKTALELLGLCPPAMRLPMVPASESERATVQAVIERHGLAATA